LAQLAGGEDPLDLDDFDTLALRVKADRRIYLANVSSIALEAKLVYSALHKDFISSSK
jgi:hypothetical protein